MANDDSILRICCVCKIGKPNSAFGPHKKNKSGLQYECRACVNAKVKAYMASKGDEYKAKKRAYDKERNFHKKEEISAKAKLRYEKSKSSRLEAAAMWAKNNPEKSTAIKQNYKHRRRAQEQSGLSYSELMEWKKAQPKVCHWCGCDCSKDPVVDHYHPLSKGGVHEMFNLVISCRSCNARKSSKSPEQWIAECQVAKNTVTPEMLQPA